MATLGGDQVITHIIIIRTTIIIPDGTAEEVGVMAVAAGDGTTAGAIMAAGAAMAEDTEDMEMVTAGDITTATTMVTGMVIGTDTMMAPTTE